MCKRWIALICLLALAAVCVGCQMDEKSPTTSGTMPTFSRPSAPTAPTQKPKEPKGEVRYVNSNPALQEAWESLAAEYEGKTGVKVRIIPADQAEGVKPTLFTVEDEDQLQDLVDVCVDLAGTNATHHIQNWDLTLKIGRKMCGLPLEVEGYGLIYNDELLRKVGVTAADITSFAKLTEVVRNIAGNTALKFDPFGCVDMNSAAVSLLGTIGGDLRPFWDLYTQNTACSNIMADDDGPMEEMSEGKGVFCIGSTKEFEMLSTMSEGNLNIMPLYIGAEGENLRGLCVRVENYLCVRNDVDALDRKATLDFLDYLTHPEGEAVPIDRLEVFTPYSTAKYFASPLEETMRNQIAAGKGMLVFSRIDAPEGLAEALKTYASKPTDENWAAVEEILK